MMLFSTLQIAKVCYEAHRALSIVYGCHTMPTWDAAGDWSKDAFVHSVQDIIANRTITPEALHTSWVKFMYSKGWSVSVMKAPELLKHPGLNDEPDEHAVIKLRLMIATVGALVSPVAQEAPKPEAIKVVTTEQAPLPKWEEQPIVPPVTPPVVEFKNKKNKRG